MSSQRSSASKFARFVEAFCGLRIEPFQRTFVDEGFLRVVASDAPLAHGLTPSLVLVDELHAHRSGELYEAMRTSMLKRLGSRMVTISTAGSDVEGFWGASGVARSRSPT
jgi:hypothetical protein